MYYGERRGRVGEDEDVRMARGELGPRRECWV